jgi:hypothetical protein
MATYKLLEESSVLYLAYFNNEGKVVYLNGSYEKQQGSLLSHYEKLLAGEDPITAQWKTNYPDPEKQYKALTKVEFASRVIADNYGIYPTAMSDTAKAQFSYTTGSKIKTLDETIKQMTEIENLLTSLNLANDEYRGYQDTDFSVYMTTRHIAVLRDAEGTMPWCVGKPEDIIRFLQKLRNGYDTPINPFINDWIYNEIQGAIDDPKTGITDYDPNTHGYGMDGITSGSPLF